MIEYFVKRTLLLIPKILIISIIIFIGIQLVPGDAADYLIPASKIAEAGVDGLEQLKEEMGLNDSYPEQYFRWVTNLFRGDLGHSSISGTPIRDLVMRRLPITMELCLLSLLFSTFFGVLFGFVAAVRHNKPIDYTLTGVGLIGISIPAFFFGLILIFIFAIRLKWLPTGGRMSVGEPGFFQRIEYLVMPCACMAVGMVTNLLLYVKNSMLDTLNMEYVKTARSKGLSPFQVNMRHCFRNAMVPVMSILVGRISILVGGSVAVETIFNFPGMGSLILESISNNDLPTVMVTVLLVTVAILVSTLLTDIFAAMLDPRIRIGQEGA